MPMPLAVRIFSEYTMKSTNTRSRTRSKVTPEADSEAGAAVLPLQYVKGIGPKRARALADIGVRTIRDLLLFAPRAYLDRRTVLPLRQIRMMLGSSEGLPEEVTAIVEVKRMDLAESHAGRKRLIVRVVDDSGDANLVFFRGVQFFIRAYQPGEVLAVSGPPEIFGGQLQWTHPELEKIEHEERARIHSGRIIPQYRQTQKMKQAGLTSRSMRTLFESFYERFGEEELEETIPERLLREHQLLPLKQAVRELHFPTDEAMLERARHRMKFEELFYFELGLALRREIVRHRDPGISFDPHSRRARGLMQRLGFELTGAQKRVVREVADDMAAATAMNRLIQGDVGSGKTVVALLAMLVAVDNGFQCAFMAPTEILAEQHLHTLQRMLDGLDVEVVQLVGGQKKRVREEMLQRVRLGQAQIVVGTHALFQESVDYANLGLVVIDEQHRFGVEQRAQLRNKGRRPDTLIMTATPIPRTLTMTLYGDLDVSVIDELPANRKPILTGIRFESNLPGVWDFVRLEVQKGRQAYIVYPLVEKSEKLELKSAVEHFEFLSTRVFPDLRLGLLHGQMLWYEKEDAMRAFLERNIDVMVATTVIEVGIDVPNASVMVIENSERFGLSQLHQLRGRVGRGADQSYCILVTKDHYRYQLRRGMTQNDARMERRATIRRLEAMRDTTDGFRISEIDLELRGPGDVVGTRQSGLPEFTHANLVTDGAIIGLAREAAFDLVERDPDLRLAEHAMIREVFARATMPSLKYADVG